MSEEPKHTPTPWAVLPDDEYPNRLHQIWSLRPNGQPDALIARTCFAPDSAANAAILGAALDLLQALMALMDIFNNRTDILHLVGPAEAKVLIAATSVINKATGNTP
jgi:hypothetical protein